ncbi:Glucose dehydrogenase [Eumeta japonica]|uniref:Glucose dehydrogenase n=1 Tax=Eumeta variegata TaxID=151549 RepID=A0A4C1T236_EUMVA|nr:Glucose dehydrogenase [Eumeta japonica]
MVRRRKPLDEYDFIVVEEAQLVLSLLLVYRKLRSGMFYLLKQVKMSQLALKFLQCLISLARNRLAVPDSTRKRCLFDERWQVLLAQSFGILVMPEWRNKFEETTSKYGVRYSTAHAFMRPAARRHNLHILVNTTAESGCSCYSRLPGVGHNLHNPVAYAVNFHNNADVTPLNWSVLNEYLITHGGLMSGTGLSGVTGKLVSPFADQSGVPDTQILLPENHQAGSCKMGPANDPQSVVDNELRCMALRNRVMDTSIIPQLTGQYKCTGYNDCRKRVHMIKQTWLNQ